MSRQPSLATLVESTEPPMEEACEHVRVWRGSCYSLHVWLSIFSHLILSTAQEARTIQPPSRNPACAMNTGVLGVQC